MKSKLIELGLAVVLLMALSACVVAPVQPVGYRSTMYVDDPSASVVYTTPPYTYPYPYYSPVYVNPYPWYGVGLGIGIGIGTSRCCWRGGFRGGHVGGHGGGRGGRR